jgi:hypothetical protein
VFRFSVLKQVKNLAGSWDLAEGGQLPKEGEAMCDYSLAGVPNRLAEEGEQLVACLWVVKTR